MATKLGERLEELATFLAHPHAVDSVEETLGHLQTEVADAMARSRASAQQCTILLFQSAEPPSLLRFLSTSADFADDARKREISSARGGVLELLAAFVKAYGTHRALTKQHVVDLYKACQQTARADPFNRVKAHALTVVVNVLKYADKRVTSDDIEPRAYAEKLFYDIKFSKATQTAKGQMLEVIGYLVEKFPKHVEENVPALLSWIENELEKQFSSNSPEMMMVNGLLFALARLLECDVERYKRDEALRKKIYSYLLTVFATTISGNLSRYQVTNSSETFLAKHAQLFKQEIGPNGFVWFSYMKFCCQSENKKIKEHAFACSNAILQVLNAYLAETKDDARKKYINQAGSMYQNIEIELDDFNQHPCMIPLLRVLVQMKTDFGSSWSEKTMPGWMKKIFDVIVDPSTGLNVRLFLAKVVLNIPDVFTMYSSSWLRAVMGALLDASAAQKAPEFSYILRDYCNLVLNSWKDVAVSSLHDTASRFVNELIKLCPERNNMICNSNVLLVTELIAFWKDSANIDASVLIPFMINDGDDAKMKSAKQFAALQIVSAMLTAGLESELLVEEAGQTIEDGILLVMASKTTSLYTLAAEVGGLYLQTAGSEGEEFMCKLRNLIIGNKSNAMLQYANAAISCNILALASKMLKNYRELCNTHQLPKLSVHMVEVFVSHVLKLVDRQEHQSDRSGPNSSSIKLITRYYETATKMFDNVEIMNMMETAGASDKVAMGYLEAKTFASAAAFYAFNDVDDNLKEEYFSRSLDMFKVSSQRIDAVSHKGVASFAFLRCRLTFIEFLNDLLFKRKMEKLAKLADRKALTKLLAENVLGGMTAGDRECAHYFPQLCDVIASYPDIVADFEQCVLTNVPLWTCLQWSAQLMALLNGPIGKTIVAILEKMAEKYPVALFYDFMVTCRSSLDKFKVDLHRLEVLLTNPVMEKFVTALRLIHHPELRLKEGLREIAKMIEDNRTADARQKVELLWKDCFSPDRPLLGTQIGRYNRDWSRKTKRDVEKIMGKDGSKMTAKTVNSAREWIMNHFGVTPGRYGITKDMKAHLGDFADDEKDYTFLVKGGEDLRLDQRIEQLFGVMNQILDADPRCRDQRLSLTTYDVIPMTQEIGLLEWVGGTSTLKGVIEAQLQIDERCVDLKSNKRQKLELFNTTAAKAYESFLLKQRGASFSAKVVAPRSKDVVDQFTKVQAMIPADLLRRQLLGLGSNFEAFLLVRDHFLKSVAVFSACSYVLGIGDRHLDNFLLDLACGRVIGIDFGVSFGAGASVLPVPELIPFRYTRQMDFVFQPYDGANLLAQEMQAVFDALRSKRQVVESVMNVFLHEPLLDWQQSTTTHQKALFEAEGDENQSTLHDSDVEMEDVEEPAPARASESSQKPTTSPAVGNATTAWLPDVKIAIARRKLEGVSPALLLKEELSQNSHLKQQLSKFHALVDAARTGDDGADEMAELSSLTQAQELLAMATAPDLLGRTFQGWMPWL
ncbi:hypothetical protein JG687_00007536 [Phytophthora cactorum]|uniref:Non-specific serine/threonine protein kinase n=1 Tax=Phytophthora cactorum TaxID=29920 RepID=A0A8T1UJE1_9STRA|nr:hypothetical protein JG687_00007536 [Phytophthora cactorum]